MTSKVNNIKFNDHYRMSIKHPSEFYLVLDQYFGQKFKEVFFRDPSAWLDKCNYLQNDFIIYKEDVEVGGVILKDNMFTCLFTIPPFDDEEQLVSLVVNYLKESHEDIKVEEVPKLSEAIYLKLGFKATFSEVYMMRNTEPKSPKLHEDYYFRSIEYEDVDLMASIIREAYLDNPCYLTVGSLEEYKEHVKYFLDETKQKGNLYDSSRVVINKETNTIIGMCLHCEDTNSAFIMSLIVKPGYQRKGIGSFLLNYSINESHKKYSRTRLSVISDNRAISLYERFGFKRGEPVVNYLLKKS